MPIRRGPIRRKPKPYTLPKSKAPRGDAGHSPKPPPRKPYVAPSNPAARDAPQTRKQDFKRAEAQKRKPSYKKAIRQAHRQRPIAERRARLREIEGKARRGIKLSREDVALWRRHVWAEDQKRTDMNRQIFTDRQRREVDRFRRTDEGRKGLKIDPILYETDKRKLRAAGFTPDVGAKALALPAKLLVGAGEGAAATTVAAYKDPVSVTGKTLSQAGKAALALPGAAVEAVQHPIKTASETVKGMEGRADESFGERVERIRKEGALEDVADAMIIAPGAGLAAKPVVSGAIRGTLPRRATRMVSGGIVERPRERGLIREVAGSAADRKLAKRQQRAVRRADERGDDVDILVREAVERSDATGVLHVAKPNVSRNRKLRKEVSKARARGVFGLKRELRIRGKEVDRLVKRLNPREKRAFYYGATYGIRTPEQGVEILTDLRNRIVETRDAAAFEPKGRQKKADMLPDIDAILADPPAHFTPRLGDTLDQLTPGALRIADEDPRYPTRQTETRRYMPLAEELGIEKGVLEDTPDLEAMRRSLRAERRGATDRRKSDAEVDDAEFERRMSGADRRLGDATPYTNPLGAAMVRSLSGDIEIPRLRKSFDEDADAYLARVKEAVAAKGLAEPIYIRSERYANEPGFGDFAVGGKDRMREDAPYRGENLRLGLQDTGLDVFLRSEARNIKAKFNFKLVNELLTEHVLTKYNTAGTATLRELKDALERDGATGFAFWNPGIYQDALRGMDPEAFDLDELDVSGGEINMAALRAATDPAAADLPGWKVVPQAVLRELEAEMTPSGAVGRGWDIAKGTMSKMILLTGNVPWLGAQVIQNALGTTAASGGRVLLPTNWRGAYKRWQSLTPSERAEVGGAIGLDATAADAAIRRMGSAGGVMTKAWRTMHDWAGWKTGLLGGRGPSVSTFNPVAAMRAADIAQNNAARILLWHTLEKKAEVKRLEASSGKLHGMQERLMASVSTRGKRLEDHPDELRAIGEQTIKFLGDFASLTAFERKVIGRGIMFYPFVRFSTRLMLYTLPIEHPVVGGVLATLGNLEAEEREEMFGEGSLRWTGGKVYLGDGRAIDITKLNPIGNAVVSGIQENRPAALLGVLPPFAGMLHNQLVDEDYFTGSQQFYKGDPSLAYKEGVGELPLADPTRGLIAANDFLSLSAAYRAMREMGINPAQGFRHDPDVEKVQGADSLIFAPRPVTFKGGGSKAQRIKAANAIRNQEVHESNDDWIAQFIPFLPENENDAERQRGQLRLEAEENRPKGRKKAPGGFGAESTGGGGFGAGGF